MLELQKSESANKLKLQRRMNRLLEQEIASLNARIDRAEDKLAGDKEEVPQISQNEKQAEMVLEDLDDLDEIRIKSKREPHPQAISYNDKRNAMKQEKRRLHNSFHSQDQDQEVIIASNESPKHKPVVNNFFLGSRRESVALKSARDRYKSANALVRRTNNRSPDKITQNMKTVDLAPKTPEAALSIHESDAHVQRVPRPNKRVSIDVSQPDNIPTGKAYEKAVADTSTNRSPHKSCPNFHFTIDLSHNTSQTPFFDVSESYLLNLCAAKPQVKDSFSPSFDSHLSVEMDYSHSIIQPRPSSLIQPPTIADSELSRPGRLQEEARAAADHRPRGRGRRRPAHDRRHETVSQPRRQGRRWAYQSRVNISMMSLTCTSR